MSCWACSATRRKKLKFVHIAGTNGKGSTAAMLASVLQSAGYRTGLYTSPHLLRFHERMRVCGREIDDASSSRSRTPCAQRRNG